MWFKKASPRRQAIREDLAERRIVDPSRGRLRQLLLVLLTFGVMAVALQFWPRNPLPYRIGEKAPTDLVALADFTFVDPVELEKAKQLAKENTDQVLSVDEETIKTVGAQLRALRENARAVASVDQMPAQQRAAFPSLNATSFEALHKIDLEVFNTAVGLFETNRPKGGVRAIPLVSNEDRALLLKRRERSSQVERSGDTYVRLATNSTLARNEVMPPLPITSLYSFDTKGVESTLRPEIRALIAQGGQFSEPLVELATDAVMNLTRPIYRPDVKLTQQLAEMSVPDYMPQGPHIEAHSVIVPAGQPIETMQYEKLIQSQEAYEKQIASTMTWAPWVNRLGLAVTAFILATAGAFYIARMTPTITVRRAWAIAGLLWITLAAAKGVAVYWPIGLLAIAPTLLVTIILVIAENPRFALGLSALHGLLVAFTIRQGLDFYIPMLAGIAIFAFGLREIRTRGKLIEIGALAGIGIFAAVWAMGASRIMGLGWSRWIGATDIMVTSMDALWGAVAGIAVAMFALAILPSIERIFKITTAMTLLELCDANKPLLRRLSQEAPGTFSHSLTVGIMAEAAGNAIGANGLLCRVGAYYHDVGKLSKPQYFIENQGAGHPNRHDKLSPAMSLLIIVGHVKDGIELAREYGLPWVVHQFIAQHHGTTLVEYFYHAARKKAAKSEDSVAVSETEFRYPGPKPQTPEAAIVMICDTCESVVRSIEEPTPGRIETAVHNMIMKRLLDGQFSECDLTLRDLSIIEEVLVHTLAGVHHGRIGYPGRNDDAADEGGIVQPA